jgi:CRP-like cAMP-binding protein
MPERLIQKLLLRDKVSDDEQAALRALPVQERAYGNGDVIVPFGARPTSSNLLLEGFICRFRDLNDGSRQIVALHVPGDFVDLQSFLLKVMDHGLMAVGPCRIAIVPHEHLTKVTRTFPHLTRLLWFSTLIDAAIHREWAMRLGALPALPRMAHLFCEIYVRLEVVGLARDHRFSIPLGQRELSEALGLSLVHTNRVLQKLRAGRLVTVSNSTFEIHDWNALRTLADFDPTYLHLEKVPR